MDHAAIGASEYGLDLGDRRGSGRCHVSFRRIVKVSGCGIWLLRYDRSVTRSKPARQNKLVARDAKGFVPGTSEARNEFFNRTPADLDAGVNDFPPGVNPGAFLPFFKSDPLGQGDADGVVDPAHFLSGNTCGNDVVDDGVHGPQELNLETAAGLPGAAVAPAQFAVDIGEIVPAMQIGKN